MSAATATGAFCSAEGCRSMYVANALIVYATAIRYLTCVLTMETQINIK